MNTNTCIQTGKVAYDSPQVAHDQRRKHRSSEFRSLKAYKCEHCKRWHLGHDRLRLKNGRWRS